MKYSPLTVVFHGIRVFLLLAFFALFFVISCTPARKIGQQVDYDFSEISLIGQYDLPSKFQFKGTRVGGLSGIDYDNKRNIYYLISDDRSYYNPARFYSVRIHSRNNGIDSVEFFDVVTLLDAGGKAYPSSSQQPERTPDPEAIRYDALSDLLVWSGEGERITRNTPNIIADPNITRVDRSGNFRDSFNIPPNLKISNREKGPRQNSTFEGLSFTNDFRFLFVSLEEPLYEDGPQAGTGDSSAWIRIAKFDMNTRTQVAQYAYRIDPVANKPVPEGAFRINGVSEILYLGDDKMLVVERSFSVGTPQNSIRVFLADLKEATDVSGIRSLHAAPAEVPIAKKLLFHFDRLNRYIDNIEGVCFGPVLPNGNRTLVFMSDDNFSETQTTQFFMFEIKK